MTRPLLLSLSLLALSGGFAGAAAAPASTTRPFIERLQPAPRGGGFQREDSWIWCGSVVRDEDGLWLMFASMWTKQVAFNPNWVTNSRIARAAHFRGPYERVDDAPIKWSDDPKISYEDAYLWREDGEYRIIFNDMTGKLTGEDHAGGYAVSADGIRWKLGTPPKAYSRRVRWDHGTEVVQGSLERPQLLIQEGRPTHLICATADGPGGFSRASRTWSVVIPLQP